MDDDVLERRVTSKNSDIRVYGGLRQGNTVLKANGQMSFTDWESEHPHSTRITCKLFTRETGLSSLRLNEMMPEGSEPSFFVREARVTLEDSSS